MDRACVPLPYKGHGTVHEPNGTPENDDRAPELDELERITAKFGDKLS
jgi:hypothetical protein